MNKVQSNIGKQIYYRIDKLAKLKRLSLKAVSEKAGFKSPNTIYNYKYGANPSNASLQAIASVLKTTPEYLKGETDNPAPKGDASASSDIMDPVLTFDGKPITGEIAQQIRNYAEFLMNKERKNTNSNE